MGEKGKQVLFFLIGILMIIVIFGAPLAEQVIFPGSTVLATTADLAGKFIFGIDETTISQATGGSISLTTYAATVVFMLTWLIIFVTFGDIINSFSSFDPTVSWLIAFCIATIAAMTGGINSAIVSLTGWFAWAGVAAVYVALGASFVVFLAIELGATPLIGWIKNRKRMQLIAKGNQTFEQATEATKNLSKMQEELSKER